jgi:hypothetical protein
VKTPEGIEYLVFRADGKERGGHSVPVLHAGVLARSIRSNTPLVISRGRVAVGPSSNGLQQKIRIPDLRGFVVPGQVDLGVKKCHGNGHGLASRDRSHLESS